MSGLERKDSGMYKVKAKNSQGEDEVEVRVNVIGPPDKPKGPLEVSDVSMSKLSVELIKIVALHLIYEYINVS